MTKLKIEDYQYLTDLMQVDAESELTSYTAFNNVYFRSAENLLQIRDNHADAIDSITLASITINHRRQGTATRIIEWLEQYASLHGADKVVIESILTENMRKLACELGYSRDSINIGNYIKKIERKN